MATPPLDARLLARQGMQALHSGDPRLARRSFEAIVAAGADDASACVALALACRGTGDGPAALAAVDRALRHEPRNLRALVCKGDLLDWMGDARSASAFYLAAVKRARAGGLVPEDLREDVARAEARCNRVAAGLEDGIRERLAASGLDGGPASARFRQSLDILFGRRTVFLQQPRYYYFPGLPQIQFYDRAAFPWMDALEAATGAVREELLAVMEDGAPFTPYVQSDPRRPRKDQDGLTDNPDWSAFYLWKNGEPVAENAARCPRTLEALSEAPIARVPNRSPSILFSQLKPGARIPPHTGLANTRLICHLPLLVPPGCGFRVGNETREWEEGKAWAFDDTIEHEAWNGSDRTRVILLFEIWRPELSDEERRLITAMFEAIDAGGGERPAWEI
jgi:aspartyl/asparaginyl beta-hydroxylase (cupin superfamily)